MEPKLIYEDDILRDYCYKVESLDRVSKMQAFLKEYYPDHVYTNITIIFENDDGYIPDEKYDTFEEITARYHATHLEDLVDHISLNTTINGKRALITMYPNGAVTVCVMKK